ncbi:hypothetical protein AAF712_016221 [Marasmius tenuissimus]|uniref:Uncharacterized protein n=1 Tax=Marasmius tenuissimus TaxID=585030 RepID=A0ABR2Z8B1_9AGAR
MVWSSRIPNQDLSPRHLPDLSASTEEDSLQIPNDDGDDDDSYLLSLSHKDGGGYSFFRRNNGEEYSVLELRLGGRDRKEMF